MDAVFIVTYISPEAQHHNVKTERGYIGGQCGVTGSVGVLQKDSRKVSICDRVPPVMSLKSMLSSKVKI